MAATCFPVQNEVYLVPTYFFEFRILESEFRFVNFSTTQLRKKIQLESPESKTELEFCFQLGSQKSELKVGIPNQAGKAWKLCRFFSVPLAKELGDSAVKFGGSCKPNNNIWSMVTAVLVDGAGVHEDSAYCRGSKLGGTSEKNVISNTLNFLLHSLSLLLSFVPLSGVKFDLDVYVNNPLPASKQRKPSVGTRSFLSLLPGLHLPPLLPRNLACIPTREPLSHPPQKVQWHWLYCTILPGEMTIQFFPVQPSIFNQALICKIAFDNAIGNNELQQAAVDAARRLLMAPIDQLVD
jgi:hypothetical protein